MSGGRVGVTEGFVGGEGYARLPDIFEAKQDFGLGALEVVGDFAGDEFLLEAFEVEVACVAEEL